MTRTEVGGRTGTLGACLAGAALAAAAIWAAAPADPAAAASSAGVQVFFPRGASTTRCDRVLPRPRTVAKPAVLTGAMRALLAGPTAAERSAGYRGWFTARTRGMLRGARVAGGVAYVDFGDLRRIIPNASSSCGSATLLAQLDRTALQFPTVRRTVYSINGSRTAFYEWLQRSAPR